MSTCGRNVSKRGMNQAYGRFMSLFVLHPTGGTPSPKGAVYLQLQEERMSHSLSNQRPEARTSGPQIQFVSTRSELCPKKATTRKSILDLVDWRELASYLCGAAVMLTLVVSMFVVCFHQPADQTDHKGKEVASYGDSHPSRP